MTDVFTPGERALILESMMRKHNLTREGAEKLLDEGLDRRSKRNPLLERQWVRLLHNMVKAIVAGTADPAGLFYSVFWIRLYGCLTEIEAKFSNCGGPVDDVPTISKFRPWLVALSEVHAACLAIRESLSQDERLFVAFSRHVNAHVYQDGFEYGINPGNPEKRRQRATVRTKQQEGLIGGRQLDVDRVHEIVDGIHAEHGNDEGRLATHFAKRVHPGVERLERALATVDAERDALSPG